MVYPLAGRTPTFLDTCCILNLYASGRMEEILLASSLHFLVAEAVQQEVLFVRSIEGNDRDPVDLSILFDRGVLEIAAPATDDEWTSFTGFAADLDEGEAMTCALARSRGGMVATDDRKALRILSLLDPPVPTLSTSRLLKTWADSSKISSAELARILVQIVRRAQFRPGRKDPLFEWWEKARAHRQ